MFRFPASDEAIAASEVGIAMTQRSCARRRMGRSHFWYFADDRLLAVDAMNASRTNMVGKLLQELEIAEAFVRYEPTFEFG